MTVLLAVAKCVTYVESAMAVDTTNVVIVHPLACKIALAFGAAP